VALIRNFQIQGEFCIFYSTPVKDNKHLVLATPYGGLEMKKIRLEQGSLHNMPDYLYGSWVVDEKYTLNLKSCGSTKLL
jgi:hypothetical protein